MEAAIFVLKLRSKSFDSTKHVMLSPGLNIVPFLYTVVEYLVQKNVYIDGISPL
eukprot:GAHX01005062.1.p1 GENE.GAHX01005062.1~~GAHX01005062.1.p1  ORF type:complete len:54 (+),score=4.87 GAHX01005062.1:336-497(+)